MRLLLKFLLFVGALALLWAAHHFYLHQTVRIEFLGVVAEPTLSLLLLAFILAVVAIHVLVRLLHFLVFLPRHIRSWRDRRATEKKGRLVEESLRAMVLGDESAAERNLTQLAGTKAASQEAYLLAAFSAQAQGMAQRHVSLLGKAVQAKGDPQSPMRRVAQGCAALADGRKPAALAEFQAALPSQPKAGRLLRLIAQCQDGLGDHQAALLAWLAVARVGAPPDTDPLAQATRHIGGIGDPEVLARLWKDHLAEPAKGHPEIALAAARQLAKVGNTAKADEILKDLAKSRPEPDVLETVATAGSDTVVDAAVPVAERQLADNGKNAPLLRALGMLYARKALWKKSREMLEASLSLVPDAATHDALAHMLHTSGNAPEEALAQHQAAMSLRHSNP